MAASRVGRWRATSVVLWGPVVVFSVLAVLLLVASGAVSSRPTDIAPVLSAGGVLGAWPAGGGVAPPTIGSTGEPVPLHLPLAPLADPVLPQVLASVNVGSDPVMAAYDGSNGFVYVANSLSGNVTILNGTTVLATVNTAAAFAGDPVYVLYDSTNGLVYVVDRYFTEGAGGAVSVLNGTSLVATVPVGVLPNAATCDGATGRVYVTNPGSDNVTVLDGLVAVADLPVGSQPVASAYDAANGYIYVANFGSNNVTLLDDVSVLASIPVGTGPDALAYDPTLGAVDVSNNGSGNVTVLAGLSIAGSPAVGTNPSFALFDPADGDVVVTNSNSSSVSVLHGTTNIATVTTGADPTWAAYDGSFGFVYVVSYATASVTLLNGTSALGSIGVGADPTSAVWGIGHGYDYVTNSVSNNVSVIAAAYAVTFEEAGLPSGSPWSATLAGVSVSSTSGSIAFAKLPGAYPYSVAGPAGYHVLSTTPASPVSVVDRDVVVHVTFGTPSSATYRLTFQETGLGSRCKGSIPPWNVTVGDVTRSTTNRSISFVEPNGTYGYTIGAPPGYDVVSTTPASPVTIAGADQAVDVAFGPGTSAQNLRITFEETGLPSGTVWCVTLGTKSCSSSSQIEFSDLASGMYPFSVGHVSGFGAEPSSGVVVLRSHSLFIPIRFSPTSPPPCGGHDGGHHGGHHGGGRGGHHEGDHDGRRCEGNRSDR
jgi:YVTN family beta-propeller protein